MNGLRVLHLTHYAELYGANRSLLDLVRTTRDAGQLDPFVVLAVDGPLRQALTDLGIAHAVVPFVPWMHKRVLMGGPHHRLLQRWRHHKAGMERDRINTEQVNVLLDLARRHRIQLVHANSSVIPLGGAVARSLGVPFVWHIRELPFKHYGFHVDGGTRRYATELSKADALIALSKAVATDITTVSGATDRITVVPNGVVHRERLHRLRIENDGRWRSVPTFNFLSAGLFHRSKMQEEVVSAFAKVHRQYPSTALYLAGDGDMDRVRALARTSGAVHAIHFLGFVPDMDSLLATSHAVVQCSRHEALGRITLEAMAHGLPVIGHASGATPELIQHDTNGLLYQDPQDLEATMLRLAGDHHAAQRMGNAGQDMVRDDYTVERMCEGVLSVFQLALRG